ncbi:MAG TPA: CPXCG motif-containing cysteine-rich protein [Candidatus Krumholzibacteria bacterium]|nr:CPXCG motif-containing cysteine-rich protein [Candidatus Krumholzibacteria bacterium]
MSEPLELYCPYCGEPVDLFVDEDGGSRQAYVEDCPVCCRPWQVTVFQNTYGDWSVDLRTSDE